MTQELLAAGLSEILPVVGGGGFAFSKFDCSKKDPPITHLGNKLEDCTHLRHVTLSDNQITDLTAVSRLPHTLDLLAENNAVESVACLENAELPWCQVIDLGGNKIINLTSFGALHRLRFLRVDNNEIASLEGFGGHPTLEELTLKGNKLTTLKGFGRLDKCTVLDLSENQLESLEGLDAPVLPRLEVSKNKLASFEHVGGAPVCEYLVATDNALEKPEVEDSLPTEILRLLSQLPVLGSMSLAGNGVGDMKLEIVVCLPDLRELDGEAITEEDRVGAKERAEQIQAAEEARAVAAAEAAEQARLEAEAAEKARLEGGDGEAAEGEGEG